MDDFIFSLFSDTGGIILLDPENADALGDDFVERLDAALNPGDDAGQTAGQDGDWARAWSEAVGGLRRMSAGGEFTLILSGEGTFHARLQTSELGDDERERLVETFEERLHVRSGRLAFTDGGEFFGEALPGAGAVSLGVAEGYYSAQIHYLERHPSLTPTVGVFGSEEHPALILRLTPAEPSGACARGGEAFPRLRPSRGRYENPRPGWNCYAQVTGVGGGWASLELMLTETVYSGHGRMSVPEGEELKAGDYVLVRLVEDTGAYWTAEWQGDPT